MHGIGRGIGSKITIFLYARHQSLLSFFPTKKKVSPKIPIKFSMEFQKPPVQIHLKSPRNHPISILFSTKLFFSSSHIFLCCVSKKEKAFTLKFMYWIFFTSFRLVLNCLLRVLLLLWCAFFLEKKRNLIFLDDTFLFNFLSELFLCLEVLFYAKIDNVLINTFGNLMKINFFLFYWMCMRVLLLFAWFFMF